MLVFALIFINEFRFIISPFQTRVGSLSVRIQAVLLNRFCSFCFVPNPRASAPTWCHHVIPREMTQPGCQKRSKRCAGSAGSWSPAVTALAGDTGVAASATNVRLGEIPARELCANMLKPSLRRISFPAAWKSSPSWEAHVWHALTAPNPILKDKTTSLARKMGSCFIFKAH